MTGTLGANPDQLRSLAQHCGTGAQSLLDISTSVSTLVNNPGFWKGPDADQVRGRWNSVMRLQIQAASTTLDRAAEHLVTQADEQERTSNDSGGPGTGGPQEPNPTSPGSSNSPDMAGVQPVGLTDLIDGAQGVWSGYQDIGNAFNILKGGQLAHFLSRGVDGIDSIQELWRAIPWNPGWAPLNAVTDVFEFASVPGASQMLLGLDIGFNALEFGESMVTGFQGGWTGDEAGAALWSGSKTVISALQFLPPPAGPVFMGINAAIGVGELIYNNWDHIEAAAGWVGDFTNDAAETAGDFADSVRDAASEAMPWNW